MVLYLKRVNHLANHYFYKCYLFFIVFCPTLNRNIITNSFIYVFAVLRDYTQDCICASQVLPLGHLPTPRNIDFYKLVLNYASLLNSIISVI